MGFDQTFINEWFDNSGIIIDSLANTLEKKNLGKQLLYTGWECFAKTLRDIKPTDLIKYFIDLKPNARPFYFKIPHYTKKDANFVTVFFQK